ncbi:hypothetical protein H310_15247 [Aphanomyces invadans]|uniref:Uncharacterized protein n=1 Tax=Aphanomyces invadans TaxID=157072 RepID=A0A024T7L4_9STRA|nr:hypothetical protein H310_15247 [Aphanomyces invadans]ETV89910.1 hypothetical protein H310_15247 [Aphanomyces invadans]|eukprot:XP_008881456.1 hypothetical protein H310_15247 [Aphanomyces invadans]
MYLLLLPRWACPCCLPPRPTTVRCPTRPLLGIRLCTILSLVTPGKACLLCWLARRGRRLLGWRAAPFLSHRAGQPHSDVKGMTTQEGRHDDLPVTRLFGMSMSSTRRVVDIIVDPDAPVASRPVHPLPHLRRDRRTHRRSKGH